MTFAIIKTGGKQYRVSEGDVLKVEKMADAKTGDKITFDEVLLTENDGVTTVGTPFVPGAKVSAEVIAEGKAKKIVVIHYKAKAREHKVNGHRQPFAQIKITSIKA